MAITAAIRLEVLLSGDCDYCGGFPSQVDHIMPRSRGGTDDRANLAPACRRCNMEKGDFTPEEYRAYREEEGLGWPPESLSDFIVRLIREDAVRRGISEEEGRRIYLEGLMREASTRRAAEWEAAEDGKVKALVIEQCQLEERIKDYRWPLARTLDRLDKVNAELAELLA